MCGSIIWRKYLIPGGRESYIPEDSTQKYILSDSISIQILESLKHDYIITIITIRTSYKA